MSISLSFGTFFSIIEVADCRTPLPPSHSCSQPPDDEASGMGQCRDKPPTPAARVLGPGFVPVTKHTLAHLTLKTTSSYCYHPHFISAGTEAQRS